MNSNFFDGYVGKGGIEVRVTKTGYAFGNFSLGNHEFWKDSQGEKQERTNWLKIVVRGTMAESLKDYVTQGRYIKVLNATVRPRSFESNGRTIWVTEFHVGDGTGGRIEFGPKGDSAQVKIPLDEYSEAEIGLTDVPVDEVPF